jgi:hypothetical protein
MSTFFMFLTILILIQYIPITNSKIDPTQLPEAILSKYDFLRSVKPLTYKRSTTNTLDTQTSRVRTNANDFYHLKYDKITIYILKTIRKIMVHRNFTIFMLMYYEKGYCVTMFL